MRQTGLGTNLVFGEVWLVCFKFKFECLWEGLPYPVPFTFDHLTPSPSSVVTCKWGREKGLCGSSWRDAFRFYFPLL